MNHSQSHDLFFEYYIYANAVTSAVECSEYETDQEIDQERLTRAVELALKRYPVFSLTPLIRKNGKLGSVPGQGKLPVDQCMDEHVALGSEDTNGYLFRVSFQENRIMFNTGHSLSDGRGMIAFEHEILENYFSGKKKNETEALPEEYESLETFLNRVPYTEDMTQVSAGAADLLSDHDLLYDDRCKKYEFSWETANMKELLKKYNASPSTLLMAALSDVVRENHDTDGDCMKVIMTADLRPDAGGFRQRNFCTSMQVDDFRCAHAGRKEKIAEIKTQILNRRSLNLQAAGFRKILDFMEFLRSTDLRQIERVNELRKIAAAAGKGQATAAYAGLGRVMLPKHASEHILSCDTRPVNTDYFPFLLYRNNEEVSALQIIQNGEEDLFARHMHRKLASYGFHLSEIRSSYHQNDTVDVTRFAREQKGNP